MPEKYILANLVFIGLSLETNGYRKVRIGIRAQKVTSHVNSVQLLAYLKVDNQDIHAVVDTGNPYIFLVWKHWYEKEYPGGCDKLAFKCYECSPAPCQPGPNKTLNFYDGENMTIFKHSEVVDFGTVTENDISFGLIAGAEGRPFASLGLAPPYARMKPYAPLMQQLMDRSKSTRLVKKSSFSLYLVAGENPTGELILGGKDKRNYVPPLVFVKVRKDQSVSLARLTIGDSLEYRMVAPTPAFFDSGTNAIIMPEEVELRVLAWLEVGGEVPVKIRDSSGFYDVSCEEADYLPSITFSMRDLKGEEVPLEIPPASYVVKDGGRCMLAIHFGEAWVLGLSALYGNYYYYDWDRNRIGFAKVK
ncbi:hypothetical protein FOZ62_023480 [Perkinsus olseni]|uniref:Peptidase A1 domain-containing protein n=2 Tax=Perkinsus olseni TaxID=32597 RepID=A0A7J6SEK9_PEROL|nr:hypothetical protein FOZ62_023480 [Perkinsus olseni]